MAALAAVILPSVDGVASGIAPPVLRATESPQSAREAPRLSVEIPRYTLSKIERETVATCLVLEAANQGEFGMRSVMAVIRNRARGHAELFAPTVLQPRQFSALNKLTAGRESQSRAISRAAGDRMWPVALAIVDEAMRGSWHDPTEGSTHYTRTGERNRWTSRLTPTVTIGSHSFYR